MHKHILSPPLSVCLSILPSLSLSIFICLWRKWVVWELSGHSAQGPHPYPLGIREIPMEWEGSFSWKKHASLQVLHLKMVSGSSVELLLMTVDVS